MSTKKPKQRKNKKRTFKMPHEILAKRNKEIISCENCKHWSRDANWNEAWSICMLEEKYRHASTDEELFKECKRKFYKNFIKKESNKT